MALTSIRSRRGQPARRRNRTAPPPPVDLDSITVAGLYDLALHDTKGVLGLGNVGGSLTASALTVQQKNSQDIRRLVQPWQAEAMSYYDLVPEVSFAATFMSQMLSRVRLFPARLDPKTKEPEEITDGAPVEILDRIKDRSGGRSEFQRGYGKLKFLIGEVYATASPDEDLEEVWECLSPNELRVQPQGIATRFRAPMLSGDQYIIGNDAATIKRFGGPLGPEFREQGPDVILVYRMWRPHPAYSWLADCSMKASRLLLEELVLSSYSVKAQLKSRLNTVGALFMPEEASFPSVGNDPDEDPQSDLLQQRFSNAILAAIREPGTASAMSPIIVQMAGEFIKDVQHIRFNDTTGELAEIAQRSEMVARFGVGAELPPEMFKSMEDTNHWSAWLVDKQTWDSYGLPASMEMASDINAAYFQPACREAGVKDWQNIMIGVDPAEVINHPNRSKDALDLFDRLLISGDVAREQLGYNDNDRMGQREKNEQAGLKVHDASLYLYDIPEVRANIEPEAGVVEGAPGPDGEPATDPATGGKAPPGPPVQATEPPAASPPAVTASAEPRTQELLALAQAGVRRGRELAGARLRSMTTGRNSRRCVDCAEAVKGLAAWDVPYTLNAAGLVAGLDGTDAHSLVSGAGEWLAAILEETGVSAGWASEVGRMVEQHCAFTLYDRVAPPFPAAFSRTLGRVHLPLEQA